MTDQQTPDDEARKIPPKLTMRKPEAQAGAPEKPEDAAEGSEASTVIKRSAAAPSQQDKAKESASPPPATGSEAPTFILKKSPSTDDQKKKTARIPLNSALSMRISDVMDDIQDKDGDAESDQSSRAAAALKTVRLARTPSEPAPPKPPADTSGEDAAPKTVRLARPPPDASATKPPAIPDHDDGGPKTVRLMRPGVAPGAGVPAETSLGSKNKTSRITLDKAFKTVGATGAPTVVKNATSIKTIRLKKPGQESDAAETANTIALKAPPSDQATEAKSRTSRLDTPESPETSQETSQEGVPATQRKTIRIKRPGADSAAGGGRTLKLARAKSPSAAEEGQAEPDGTVAPSKKTVSSDPGLVFTLAAVAAVVVAGFLLYMIVAQALPEAGLTWWGQINF